MSTYLFVACGGALGSVARLWAAKVVAERVGQSFPWGTLFVNITGSFFMGLLSSWHPRSAPWITQPNGRAFLMVGVCGGYTTFSAFSLQTLALVQADQWTLAASNAVLSFILCLAAVWLGYLVGARLSSGTA